MTDDLVKRARHNAKADMPHHASVALIEEMTDRIEELEAKLVKAVETLAGVDRFAKDLEFCAEPNHHPVTPLARACEVYAELKGETDE